MDNNDSRSVDLRGASSATAHDSFIRENGGDGIHLSDTSVAVFQGGPNEITDNQGWGINCDPAPSVAQITGNPGTVTGNAAGQINCP